MSHKASNQVWGSTLSRTDLIVALALADICDDQGRGIYPSIRYASWKSNLSERTVQRVISKFVRVGILQVVRGPGRSRPTEYRMILDEIVLKPEWQKKSDDSAESGITSNGGSNDRPGRVREPPHDDRGDTLDRAMSEKRSPVPGSDPGESQKGDSLSPFPGERAEKLSTKGDRAGVKGDSADQKGDTGDTLSVLTHEPRERDALSQLIFRCPPGFKVSDELRAEISRGLTLTKTEIENEIRKFRIYPFERKVPDWSAKLCVWIARADEYKQNHGAPPATHAKLAGPIARDQDPDAEILCVTPPTAGETVKHYQHRVDVARCSLKQADALARQLGIDTRFKFETLNELNARVGTAQLDKLRSADA